MRQVIDVKYKDLGNYELPVKTQSYEPVGHQDLIDKVISIAKPNYGVPTGAGFRIAGGGNQMFAHLDFKTSLSEDANISIGIRNSYNKSLAVGICSGASIIVCDNLMFVGDVVKLRKHTSKVWEDLDMIIEEGIQAVGENFETLMDASQALSDITINDTNAAHVLGELFVNENILASNQLNVAAREWKEGGRTDVIRDHPWADRTAWSLYNACTEALKISHPSEVMDRQVKLHEFFHEHYELT
tara:strand:- start:18566 stop:19294 length:729 start_codon:yes stop_codon:yes gene_type:complete